MPPPSVPPQRLRVLMPSIVDPAVRRGGAWTVSRSLVELLRREPWNAEVTVLVPPEPRWRRGRQAAALVAALAGGAPAKVGFLRSRDYEDRVRHAAQQGGHDLLLINGTDLLWCLDLAPPGCRTLAIVHNREAQLFADQVAASPLRAAFLRRRLLRDGARLHELELAGLARVDGAVFLSEADAAAAARELPGLARFVLAPQFGDPPQRIPKAGGPGLDLGLLANFDWWPNRDGARWLVREVLDHLPGDVRLHLFGHGSGDALPPHPRVVAHGFVDDLRQVWAACDWMVVPTRYGAGVSVKCAESLYHGMPVLATHFGLRGLPAIDHPLVACREGAAEWIAFLSGPQARRGARLPAEASGHFDLAANTPRVDRFLAGILAGRPVAALQPEPAAPAGDLVVLCVKWGTKYPADYVNRLRSMVARNLPLPHRFVCLTDDPAGLDPRVATLPLAPADLEYCWNKLLLFDRLPFEGTGLYLDLDVVVTGDLTPLVTARPGDPFVGVLDWYRRDDPQFNASVMRFRLNRYGHVLEEFRRRVAQGRLVERREWDAYLGRRDKVVYWEDGVRYGGDQEWTSRRVYRRSEIHAHCFPEGTVLSYKKHGRRRLPEGCRVMVFHGEPKPHEVDVAYVREHWR